VGQWVIKKRIKAKNVVMEGCMGVKRGGVRLHATLPRRGDLDWRTLEGRAFLCILDCGGGRDEREGDY